MKLQVFTMQSCNPCKQLKDNISKAGLVTNIEFYDVSDNMHLAKQHNIRSVPTTLLVDAAGNVLQRISGSIQVADLLKLQQQTEKATEQV